MQDVMQLRRDASRRLYKLDPSKLRQVLDFMDSLLDRSARPSAEPASPQGSVQDLLAVAGSWKFEPGELEEILQDIEQSRLMELEDEYRWLT